EAGAGGCGHDASPGRSCAVHHVDGGDFALRLEKRAVDLRQKEGCRFGDLAGGSDGISEIGAASGEDGTLDDGDISLTELPHGILLELCLLRPRGPEASWVGRGGRR